MKIDEPSDTIGTEDSNTIGPMATVKEDSPETSNEQSADEPLSFSEEEGVIDAPHEVDSSAVTEPDSNDTTEPSSPSSSGLPSVAVGTRPSIPTDPAQVEVHQGMTEDTHNDAPSLSDNRPSQVGGSNIVGAIATTTTVTVSQPQPSTLTTSSASPSVLSLPTGPPTAAVPPATNSAPLSGFVRPPPHAPAAPSTQLVIGAVPPAGGTMNPMVRKAMDSLASRNPSSSSTQPKTIRETKHEQTKDGALTIKAVTEIETTEIPAQNIIVKITKQTITTRTIEVIPIPSPEAKAPTHKTIDFSLYPHILQSIARYASPGLLHSLRATCKDVQNIVDRELCRHITPSEGENLRAKNARIWFEPDDERVNNAVFIDLGEIYAELTTAVLTAFQSQLTNIRLIRATEVVTFGTNPAIVAIAQAVPEAWIVTRVSLSRRFRDHCLDIGPSFRCRFHWGCPWTGAETIRNCVIQLSYHTAHKRMSESKLQFRFASLDPTMPRTHYIIFSHHEQDHARFGLSKKVKVPEFAMPPVKPRVLNSLIRCVVLTHAARIVLVDAATWKPDWLSRKYKHSTTHELLVEDTPLDADILERLRWWIQANAVAKSAGDEFTKNQAIENISFITIAEFKERVPSAEMFQLITDPLDKIGVENDP
ncbi:uncharacterized protein CcaverHIS019_0202540 [Cutaneotrichosporon cavernicola]|uniref:Uncharacterized protein n=1 Tax=Cutaneotrichosporon cavernicola TaxID=279322 RepID=A0AA48I9W8_9TREE|nr:uncharacterized protein CcaverHIS019_0202540 [Cutaneotrichosporon cavernicola]BEI88892.1 hypothetical protein CcaverHIS019_0202540 [Cutaneotrichosporon cavernicola]BEJ04440.1 hypothetical protein CcaverHIS641_0202570 [Cutaneotrichosporon cavernicola]